MFAIIPVGVNYSARRYPVVTFTLMGICTAVYLATLSLAVFNAPPGIHGFAAEQSNPVYEWTRNYLWLIPAKNLWWTYLTSMFVHAGLFHLLGNMVYLFLFGSCVEDIIGRVRYVLLYLACGLAAAFAHIAITPDHFSSMTAVGAVFYISAFLSMKKEKESGLFVSGSAASR